MNDSMRRDAISRVGITIAIDGPAGSGKSTVSKALATRLGIGYLDTGAMYRALTWYCLDRGIDLADGEAVAAAADEMPLQLVSDPADPHVWVGDREVTQDIRDPRIALEIKHVSTNLAVRAWMATEQRCRMMEAREKGSGMIAEGRDITTVVCPDADVRILLLADQEARLRCDRGTHGERACAGRGPRQSGFCGVRVHGGSARRGNGGFDRLGYRRRVRGDSRSRGRRSRPA